MATPNARKTIDKGPSLVQASRWVRLIEAASCDDPTKASKEVRVDQDRTQGVDDLLLSGAFFGLSQPSTLVA